jgi:hypothetical protein
LDIFPQEAVQILMSNKSRSLMKFQFTIPLILGLVCFAGCNKSQNQQGGAQQQSAASPASQANPEPQPQPQPAPPQPPPPVVIPAGTTISVVTDEALGSKSSTTGDGFGATVIAPVSVDGNVVIPAHSSAKGTVVEAKAKGKVKGEARLKLALTRVTINGTNYRIETTMTESTKKGKGKRTAVATGGGAALGAIIGGIAGGGKGAAIGAGVGGGAGFAGGALTGNDQIELPAETRLNFKLTSDLTLNEPSSQ